MPISHLISSPITMLIIALISKLISEKTSLISTLISQKQVGNFCIFPTRKKVVRALSSKCIKKTKGHNMKDQECLMTTNEVAKFIGVAPYTIAKYRMKKMGPKYLRMGIKTIRYRKSDVIAWLERITRENWS